MPLSKQKCVLRKCCGVSQKCSDIPPHNLSYEVTKMRCEVKYPDRLSDIPPTNLSDEVTKITCETNYPDRLSDISPCNLSDEVTKIRCEMKYPNRLSDIAPSGNIQFSGLAIAAPLNTY